MFHIPIKTSALDDAVNTFTTAYKSEILSLIDKWWKEEDIKGKSFIQFKVQKYQAFLYLLVIIYKEVLRTDGLGITWNDFVTKYDLDSIKKCLACDKIDVIKGLNSFGFKIVSTEGGIELMQIENNFVIEGDEILASTFTIQERRFRGNFCVNNIEDENVPQTAEETSQYFDGIEDTITNNTGTITDIT